MHEFDSFADRSMTRGVTVLRPGTVSARRIRPLALAGERVGRDAATLMRLVPRSRYVDLPEPGAVLGLHPARQWDVEWSNSVTLAGPAGPIEIADGVRLLRALTGIDLGAMPHASAEQKAWFHAAFLGRLGVTPFAGTTRLAHPAPAGASTALPLEITLQTGRHLLTTQARADVATWSEFLSRTEWSRGVLSESAFIDLATDSVVRVARHTLPVSALRTLGEGDVILPDSADFGCDGVGRVQLGGFNLRVRYCAARSLEVIAVEGKVNTEEKDETVDDEGMNDFIDVEQMLDDDTAEGEESQFADNGGQGREAYSGEEAGAFLEGEDAGGVPAFEQTTEACEAYPGAEQRDETHMVDAAPKNTYAKAPEAISEAQLPPRPVINESRSSELDTVPVNLAFVLGKVRFPVGEVRTLGPGSIVLFQGGSPASVAIVSSGRTLGRGEIVDVEGQLGIRITQWSAPC